MDEKKFGDILTFALIILIVIILGILGYFGYATISKNKTKANSEDALKDFQQAVNNTTKNENKVDDTTNEENIGDTTSSNASDILNQLNNPNTDSSNNSSSTGEEKKIYMENYEVVGTIKIPKTKLEIPILEKVTKRSLELSVALFDGPGLNEIGNTTIMGHNYRNGLFFSDNEKLTNGDKVYITDKSGTKIEYEIYNIYETDPSEAEYMRRDTNGKREISLSTCSDDSATRLIILAAEE